MAAVLDLPGKARYDAIDRRLDLILADDDLSAAGRAEAESLLEEMDRISAKWPSYGGTSYTVDDVDDLAQIVPKPKPREPYRITEAQSGPAFKPVPQLTDLGYRLVLHEAGHACGCALVGARPLSITCGRDRGECLPRFESWHTTRHRLIVWASGPVMEMDCLGAINTTWQGVGGDDSDDAVYRELAADYDGDPMDVVHETRCWLRPGLHLGRQLAEAIQPTGYANELAIREYVRPFWGLGLRAWERPQAGAW